MKKMTLVLIATIAFISCNNGGTETKEPAKDSTAASHPNYPYTIKQPDNWQTGSSENTMVALGALRAYEDGNVAESMKYFGDSVHLQFDAMDTTLSNDSMKTMFTKERSELKNMNVKMDDWESVISNDKKEEWVTLWYRQSWEDMKGKKDSADIVDDMNIKNGKIVRLDEYTRKLH